MTTTKESSVTGWAGLALGQRDESVRQGIREDILYRRMGQFIYNASNPSLTPEEVKDTLAAGLMFATDVRRVFADEAKTRATWETAWLMAAEEAGVPTRVIDKDWESVAMRILTAVKPEFAKIIDDLARAEYKKCQ